MHDYEILKDKITKQHRGDEKQLEAIFSDERKLIIEAPAGSGKTKTLVSKIAVMMASGQVSKNKKILALTFGVNAAYKIKKDIALKLPEIDSTFINNPSSLNKRITVTNFHGFAKKVLKLYGYLLNDCLKNFEELESIEDSDVKTLLEYKTGISEADAHWITDFNKKIRENEVDYLTNIADFCRYEKYHFEYFLKKGKITYNGYLVLLLKLFRDNPKLLEFYSILYEVLIIDEFQDTNMLAWHIIQALVSDKTQLYFFGDSLQRIYGFIGAIENLIEVASAKYNMHVIKFIKNYRFENNQHLLQLDKNIRCCSENIEYPLIANDAEIYLSVFATQNEEALYISDMLPNFILHKPNEKIALLVKQRSGNTKILLDKLEENNINYFYALFNEDDNEYIKFHINALEIFIQCLKEKKSKRLSNNFLNNVKNRIRDLYAKQSQTISSLLKLLDVFFVKVNSEYNFLTDDEKVNYISDMIFSKSLKQNMEYLEDNIVITTIHGAKGLEWDNILLMDMENYCFPFWGLCNECNNKKSKIIVDNNCIIDLKKVNNDKVLRRKYIEELSVFYVAVTRAKKELLVTSSLTRFNAAGVENDCKHSCFLSLPGIIPVVLPNRN